MDTLRALVSFFIDFRVHFGSLLGPTLATIGWFCVIWDVKVEDSSQVHFFGDPGMEMMPECRGWMWLNRSKNNGSWMISLLTPIQWFGVREVVLGFILTPFGDLEITFSDFWRYWEQAWNVMVFRIPWGRPHGPQELRQPTKVKGTFWSSWAVNNQP